MPGSQVYKSQIKYRSILNHMTIPERASNAGPEESRPRDWYEWLDEATDLISQAKRCNRDLISNERDERLMLIFLASAAIVQAAELLTGAPKVN